MTLTLAFSLTSDHKIPLGARKNLWLEQSLDLCMGQRGLEVAVETVLDVFFGELLLVGNHGM